MTHKAAFVNILGNPNVGKSTLMNLFVGEKLSAVTSKSQTTRHNIKGIINSEEWQIVFSDTPGILKPAYKLQEAMLKYSEEALTDADIIIYVVDIFEKEQNNIDFLEKIIKTKLPVLFVINKIDLSNQSDVIGIIDKWKEIIPNADFFPVSALENFNIESLLKRIIELSPESPPYFPKDQLTDRSERFFVTEIIREKILKHYKKEIPYSVEVTVETFKEEEDMVKIGSVIYVERESQKGIIIGHKGNSLKLVGTEARKEMETFFRKKVYLELFVKVAENWRSNEKSLKRFGY